MVKFPFKKNDGFQVSFPTRARDRGPRRDLASTKSLTSAATNDDSDTEIDTGSTTRAFLPHLRRDSHIGSDRKIDLDYNDDDLDAIESNEESIDAAAIQARRSYVLSKRIHRLKRALAVLVTALLGEYQNK